MLETLVTNGEHPPVTFIANDVTLKMATFVTVMINCTFTLYNTVKFSCIKLINKIRNSVIREQGGVKGNIVSRIEKGYCVSLDTWRIKQG